MLAARTDGKQIYISIGLKLESFVSTDELIRDEVVLATTYLSCPIDELIPREVSVIINTSFGLEAFTIGFVVLHHVLR